MSKDTPHPKPIHLMFKNTSKICAFQFWKKANENREATADGCVQSVIGDTEQWLDGVDDQKL